MELGLRGVYHQANTSFVSVPWAHHEDTAASTSHGRAPAVGEINEWLGPILAVTASAETDVSSVAGPSTDETTADVVGRLNVTSSQTADHDRFAHIPQRSNAAQIAGCAACTATI